MTIQTTTLSEVLYRSPRSRTSSVVDPHQPKEVQRSESVTSAKEVTSSTRCRCPMGPTPSIAMCSRRLRRAHLHNPTANPSRRLVTGCCQHTVIHNYVCTSTLRSHGHWTCNVSSSNVNVHSACRTVTHMWGMGHLTKNRPG